MDTYIFLAQLLTFGMLLVVFLQQSKAFNILQVVGDQDSMAPKYPYLGTHITVKVKGIGCVSNEDDKYDRYYDVPMCGEFQTTFKREDLLVVRVVNAYVTKDMAGSVHTNPEGEYTFRDACIVIFGEEEDVYELDTAYEAERLSYFMATGTVLEPEWEW